MRISDWSSDVCSSDLATIAQSHGVAADHVVAVRREDAVVAGRGAAAVGVDDGIVVGEGRGVGRHGQGVAGDGVVAVVAAVLASDGAPDLRSEEHTSELQSLMRISYAVFCLKKQIQHSHYH